MNTTDTARLLPPDWDPRRAGEAVLSQLVTVTAPAVKGAHDADLALAGGRAYVVAEVNDRRPGESAGWPEIYAALSIVELAGPRLEQVLTIARGGQVFANVTLPVGACFVPRLLTLDDGRLRCFFALEQPGRGESQIWYRDFDPTTGRFANELGLAQLATAAGLRPLQPRYFHADAVAHGFNRPARDFGLYLFDSFKRFDGQVYVALNNFPVGQNALARVLADGATFEVLGHYHWPLEAKLTESAVNRLPDGAWLAICRQESGDRNYLFTSSPDGRQWSPATVRPPVLGGTSSKPTFDRFGGIYYLGWQEATRLGGVERSVFNLDISRDGVVWERKYRFETTRSFQYPTFREHAGAIWLTVTQGDHDPSRKERICFGKLEDLGDG